MATCFSRTRVATALAVAGDILIQGAAIAGPIARRGFSASEQQRFEQLERNSRDLTRDVEGSGIDGLITPGSLLAVAALAGIIIWAANSDGHEDECIINGKKIDPNSSECRRAADLASSDDH